MLLTGRWIDAGKAWQIKLVNRVVPKKQLRKTVKAIAARIASHDPAVMRCAKQAVVQGLDLPLAEGLNLERILTSRFGPGSIVEKA
jgi:enoyl-CoA hydratase/carnithine racemase